jgi:hypothetical protein
VHDQPAPRRTTLSSARPRAPASRELGRPRSGSRRMACRKAKKAMPYNRVSKMQQPKRCDKDSSKLAEPFQAQMACRKTCSIVQHHGHMWHHDSKASSQHCRPVLGSPAGTQHHDNGNVHAHSKHHCSDQRFHWSPVNSASRTLSNLRRMSAAWQSSAI